MIEFCISRKLIIVFFVQLDLLAEFDTIDKLLAKNRLRSEQRSGGKYSVEILKLWESYWEWIGPLRKIWSFWNVVLKIKIDSYLEWVIQIVKITIIMIGIIIVNISPMCFDPILWKIRMARQNSMGEKLSIGLAAAHRLLSHGVSRHGDSDKRIDTYKIRQS